MSRDINTRVYTGEYTLNEYVKFTDNFYTCVNNGTLSANRALDDSCYLGYCIGDSLTVPSFVKIINDNGTIKIGDRAAIRLPVNNYMLTVNQQGSLFANNCIELFYLIRNGASSGQRMGESATGAEIPKIAPCTHIATAYCVLLIKCRIAQYYTVGDVYTFNNEETLDYDDVVSQPDSYWDNHACLAMWAEVYIGNSVSRSASSVGVSASMGGNVIDVPLIDDNTIDVGSLPSTKLLQSIYNMADGGACLLQGNLTSVYVSDSSIDSNGKNIIYYLPFSNPTFWDIVCTNNGGSFIRFRPVILDKLRFMSAFRAYNCTGLLYTGNLTAARQGDPLTNDSVYKAKTSNDGKISPSNLADDKSKGLASDPNNMYIASGFDGNENIDPNNYVDETPLTKPTLTAVGVFNRTFVVNYTALRNFADWLWNADDSIFDQIVEGLALLGENPLQGIIDVRLYPFDVGGLVASGGSQAIKIGRVTSPISGLIVTGTDNAIINLGECTFTKHFKSYLDYSPYTEARLYIPYCGVIPIDTAEYMGHRLSAKMIVDLVTGSCCALIYKDDIITYTAQGVVGVSIPFTGTDSAAYAQSVLGSVFNGAISVAGAKSPLDIMSGAGQILQGIATPTQYAQGGSPTPSCGNWTPQYAYLIITRPKPIPPDDYGHCVGYACEVYDTLNTFSGYTVITNPDLRGFTATETEKEMIKSLMQEGIYL